jgi:hypothetical protein
MRTEEQKKRRKELDKCPKRVAERRIQRIEKRISAGCIPWSNEMRNAHLRAIGEKNRLTETREERNKRMANSHSVEARKKHKETQLAKGENMECALFWSLISPEGVVYRFRNLAAFIRNNKNLFTSDQLSPVNFRGRTRIEAAIAMLSPRRKNCVERCHGWRWHIDGKHHETFLSVLPNVV